MVGFGLAKKSGALLTELLGPGRVTVRPGQLRAHRWHRAHTLPGLIRARLRAGLAQPPAHRDAQCAICFAMPSVPLATALSHWSLATEQVMHAQRKAHPPKKPELEGLNRFLQQCFDGTSSSGGA